MGILWPPPASAPHLLRDGGTTPTAAGLFRALCHKSLLGTGSSCRCSKQPLPKGVGHRVRCAQFLCVAFVLYRATSLLQWGCCDPSLAWHSGLSQSPGAVVVRGFSQ